MTPACQHRDLAPNAFVEVAGVMHRQLDDPWIYCGKPAIGKYPNFFRTLPDNSLYLCEDHAPLTPVFAGLEFIRL